MILYQTNLQIVCLLPVFRGHTVQACIVVRHLSPTQEDIVHGGTSDVNEENTYRPIGERPCRRLEVILNYCSTLNGLMSSTFFSC